MIEYYCYMIINDQCKNYIGFTTNPNRRIRQHNKEIKGGAKYTSKYNNWKYLFLIGGFKTKQEALQCEWRLKHPNNKYLGNYIKRINYLDKIFKIGCKFTKNTKNTIKYEDTYFLYININYKELFKNLKLDNNILILYTYISILFR